MGLINIESEPLQPILLCTNSLSLSIHVWYGTRIHVYIFIILHIVFYSTSANIFVGFACLPLITSSFTAQPFVINFRPDHVLNLHLGDDSTDSFWLQPMTFYNFMYNVMLEIKACVRCKHKRRKSFACFNKLAPYVEEVDSEGHIMDEIYFQVGEKQLFLEMILNLNKMTVSLFGLVIST